MKRPKNESAKAVNKKAKDKIGAKPRKPTLEDVRELVHLLQVHQIELEHQNEELRLTQEELEVSRNKYVNLFDFSPIPYFTLDPDSIIKEVNISASKMFGIDRNKLIGKHFIAYIPLPERDIYNSFLNAVLSSPEKQSCELTMVKKDKRIFHVRVEGVEVIDILESDRKCQIALIDVTK
jgi:PAS domain S-box-containing protein